MSKKLLYLLGILLTIIVGTILHWYFSCDCGVRSGNIGSAKADNYIVAIPDEKVAVEPLAARDSAETMNWQAVRDKRNADPLILYYEINKADISLNQEEIQKNSYPD